MYQSIYKYAKGRRLSKEKYRCQRKIAAYVILDDDGEYEGVEVVPANMRFPATVADTGKFYTSGMACPVCDKKATIFGERKHESWIELMKQGAKYCEAFSAVNTFMASDQVAEAIEDLNSLTENEFISFRVDYKNLETNEEWYPWFDNMMDEKNAVKHVRGVSCLTGYETEIIPGGTKFPHFHGPMFSTGAPVYSAGHQKQSGPRCAFTSYGMDTDACPMSREEAETIQAGVEHLFNSRGTISNELNIVYWLDKPDEYFNEITDSLLHSFTKNETDISEVYKTLLSAVSTGKLVNNDMDTYKDVKFHAMGYRTSQGRFMLIDERVETYEQMLKNILKWYQDTTVDIGNSLTDSTKCITKLPSVFGSLLGKKNFKDNEARSKAIEAQFGNIKQALISAAMFGTEIPSQYCDYACQQIIKSIQHGYNKALFDAEDAQNKAIIQKYSPRTSLRIIKAYLIRKGYNMLPSLDRECTNPGYLCGRLLATMDSIQYTAHRDKNNPKYMVNRTIGELLYQSSILEPRQTLSGALADYVHHYRAKIRNNGFETYNVMYDKLLSEIMGLFGSAGIPEHLTSLDQSLFHAGYLLQRQEFFKNLKKKDTDNKGTAPAASADGDASTDKIETEQAD